MPQQRTHAISRSIHIYRHIGSLRVANVPIIKSTHGTRARLGRKRELHSIQFYDDYAFEFHVASLKREAKTICSNPIKKFAMSTWKTIEFETFNFKLTKFWAWIFSFNSYILLSKNHPCLAMHKYVKTKKYRDKPNKRQWTDSKPNKKRKSSYKNYFKKIVFPTIFSRIFFKCLNLKIKIKKKVNTSVYKKVLEQSEWKTVIAYT